MLSETQVIVDFLFFLDMKEMNKSSMLYVTRHQWMWSFIYPQLKNLSWTLNLEFYESKSDNLNRDWFLFLYMGFRKSVMRGRVTVLPNCIIYLHVVKPEHTFLLMLHPKSLCARRSWLCLWAGSHKAFFPWFAFEMFVLLDKGLPFNPLRTWLHQLVTVLDPFSSQRWEIASVQFTLAFMPWNCSSKSLNWLTIL